MSTLNSQRKINITTNDLPLCCPLPSMTTWNAHPRVFLALDANNQAYCPYCGNHYTLIGQKKSAH